jgi:serine/threonine protein kinase
VTPERWAQIEELFHRAVESDPQRRILVLKEACANDPELRQEVEALLSADQSARTRMRTTVRSEIEAAAFSLIGETISHYRLLDGIGGGGMGMVYRAEDLKLGRHVAIKFLAQESAADPDALRRFEREARSASALEHPNICPIYEFGEHQGLPFLVMQLLEGHTLRELILSAAGNAPFDIPTLIDIAIGITDGLNAAHSQGIIHRDIKPANIFVTTADEVKILDFGLAKLAQADPNVTESGTRNNVIPDLFLSRTGATMGTAAYMSPEQIRDRKVDARSDLFSFGLVLYEMAAGRQAFSGETVSDLQEAILTQTPKPARELNPATPSKLEQIIERCIEKDLQRRYQSASEIRADLLRLKKPTGVFPRRRWAAGAAIVAIAFAGFWYLKHLQLSTLPQHELKLHQLTANSPENGVSGGMISPDGRYLAYSDHRGLHIRIIETGETQTIPRPNGVRPNFEWKCAAWSPDSSNFLVNSSPPTNNPLEITDDDVSIWRIPVASRVPQELRRRAFAWSFSPDGSLIAFGTNKGPHGPREIWLMAANGEHAHKQFESGNDDTINTASWSADGKRLVYARDHGAEVTLFSQDLNSGPPVVLEMPAEIKDRRIDFGISLPDGRTIYSVTELEASVGGNSCNFWLARNDLRNGKLIEKPRKVTNWAGYCMDPTSVTADGKKLAFLEMSGHPTVQVADLASDGIHITNERHLTLTESMDVLADWTPDSQSIVFFSNQSARRGIYRQQLDVDGPEPLLTTQEDLYVCCVTPDGKSFVYATNTKRAMWNGAGDLMLIPLAGGNSQKLFSARNVGWWGCARFSSALCAIAERSEDRAEVVITSFDADAGRGSELTRMAVDPNVDNWLFAVSPEGRRFAVIRRPDAPLQIMSLSGAILQEINIPGRIGSAPITWARDGKALYVPVVTSEGAQLLHVDLRGGVRVVRNNLGGDYTFGIPSPDGHHLAIESTADNKNMWLMEDF